LILTNVLKIDIFIGIAIGILCLMFFTNYTFALVIGLSVAFVNFVANAVTTGSIVAAGKGKLWIMISSAVRIVITICIVLLLYSNNKYNFIAFIVGYSFHYVAVILNGLLTKKIRKG
jgi:ATP synthase protein I